VRAAARITHDREPVDAQRVGDAGDVGRGGEQRLGRCASARCAVLPENSQLGGAVTVPVS
jgi:hypothetical protein